MSKPTIWQGIRLKPLLAGTAQLAADASTPAFGSIVGMPSDNVALAADLDSKADLVNGIVPVDQLPEVNAQDVEYDPTGNAPATTVKGKLDELVANAAYLLGETSTTAYRGDRGKTAYDHSQLTSGNPHSVTKANVGLSNVNNIAATANDTDANLKARANHTGTQSADTVTDGSTNKAYTATEQTKLSGIATAATANSSDATLLARANHTGSQAESTITNLTTDLAAKQASLTGTFSLANFTDPGNGTASAAVTGTIGTLVFGYVTYTPNTTTTQTQTFQVETAVGSGSYTTVQVSGVVAALTNVGGAITECFNFFVPTGRKWKHNVVGAAAVTSVSGIAL